ncbi:MAG: pDH2 [Parachlamydiales bacterium]|nr:pDH2 [Parachlamydiales bacterium]
MIRSLKFYEAIREATDQAMAADPSIYVMGLGVPDPKGIFGTTLGLAEKYGSERVLDMPTSENAMTGIAIGTAIGGMRPIMTHQRADFFLLALDQLINNAAKWRTMFAGQMKVPLVIRLIIGRGWGQGPQHSQSLHSLFAHIPGLNVVAPSNPYDAKGLLMSAMTGDDPVIYLEHRWLHGIYGNVPKEVFYVPFGQAKITKTGSDLTIVASSHMTLEAWKAAQLLSQEGIEAEVIDLRSLRPLDESAILQSVCKTGRLIVADDDWKTGGFAAEIIAMVTEKAWCRLKGAPQRVTYPDSITPTSWALSNHYYPGAKEITSLALKMLDRPMRSEALLAEILQQRMLKPLDTPDPSFTGPF